MRTRFLVLLLHLSFASFACGGKVTTSGLVAIGSSPPLTTKVTFDQLKPVLQRCQPCHFSGGKVYEKLPFDRPETVRSLGTKLFSRIRDEQERQLIREFLAEN